jgi:hypothetical protein
VIQVFVKTLNFCIIKTPVNPVLADPLPHTGVFYNIWNLTPMSYIEALNMSR